MAWTDSQGRKHRHRRPNGWPPDEKAPDGGVSYGWRRVAKGRVQFAQRWWTAPGLADLEGRFVRVQTECPWWTEAVAYPGHPDANPETYLEHHYSFYTGVPIRLTAEDDTGRVKAEAARRKNRQ